MAAARFSAVSARLPDDPKLQVSHSDLSAVSMPVQPYVPVVQQPCGAAAGSSAGLSTVALQRAARFVTSGCYSASANRGNHSYPAATSASWIPICWGAGLRSLVQEPDNLHCSWYFPRSFWGTQLLCRIYRPCGGSTLPYRFDAGPSRHCVVALGHCRNLYCGKGQHRPSFQLSAWVTNEILHSAPTQ